MTQPRKRQAVLEYSGMRSLIRDSFTTFGIYGPQATNKDFK